MSEAVNHVSVFKTKPQAELNRLLLEAAVDGEHIRENHLVSAGADYEAVFEAYSTIEQSRDRYARSYSTTSLYEAVKLQHLKVVELLCMAGAKVNVRCELE